jgi:hypothetical protein
MIRGGVSSQTLLFTHWGREGGQTLRMCAVSHGRGQQKSLGIAGLTPFQEWNPSTVIPRTQSGTTTRAQEPHRAKTRLLKHTVPLVGFEPRLLRQVRDWVELPAQCNTHQEQHQSLLSLHEYCSWPQG